MYTFAALANESRALLALGYAHMKGLGVPKSCESAALYYIAAAEQVVADVQTPTGLVTVCSAETRLQHSAALLTALVTKHHSTMPDQ